MPWRLCLGRPRSSGSAWEGSPLQTFTSVGTFGSLVSLYLGSAAPVSRALAAQVARLPNLRALTNATLVPEEAMRHADSVVAGYAEESWPQLLRDLRQSFR